MGIDLKYGTVTVEKVRNRPIGDDEPVVVFRAQDTLLPEVLRAYEQMCQHTSSPQDHLDLIQASLNAVVDWQRKNLTQTPGFDELPVE